MHPSRKFLLALALFAVFAGSSMALGQSEPGGTTSTPAAVMDQPAQARQEVAPAAGPADPPAGHELHQQPAGDPSVTPPEPAAAPSTDSTAAPGGHDHGQPAAQAGAHDGHAMGQMPDMAEVQRMDEAMAARMRELQARMDVIAASTDPAERKRLLDEHLEALTQAIGLLRELDGQMMQSMMPSGKCPMMGMMSSPQGHAGMQNMMDHMSMCRSMMQQKAARQYLLLEQIVAAQKELLKAVP